MGLWNLKTLAAGIALVGASVGTVDAASVVYDNALTDTNGRSCNFTASCTVELAGSDAAAGTNLTLSIVNGIADGAIPNDGDFFQFSLNAFGLGIGFIDNSRSVNSAFPAVLTLEVDRSVTWTGGSFTAVESLASVSGPTSAVRVTGTGVDRTIFEDETNFNPRPGNATQGAGFTPRSYAIENGGINFLAGEAYTLSFRDFGAASDGTEAFVQFNDMEFLALAAPSASPLTLAQAAPAPPPVPLPATAWMMISALGFFGWRKYRAS